MCRMWVRSSSARADLKKGVPVLTSFPLLKIPPQVTKLPLKLRYPLRDSRNLPFRLLSPCRSISSPNFDAAAAELRKPRSSQVPSKLALPSTRCGVGLGNRCHISIYNSRFHPNSIHLLSQLIEPVLQRSKRSCKTILITSEEVLALVHVACDMLRFHKQLRSQRFDLSPRCVGQTGIRQSLRN
jgi:hypothetical protein